MLLKILCSKKQKLRALSEIFVPFSLKGSRVNDFTVSTACIMTRACGLRSRWMHFHQGYTFSWKILVIQDFRELNITSCSLSVAFPATYLAVQNGCGLVGSNCWVALHLWGWLSDRDRSHTDIKSHLHFVSRGNENSWLAHVVKCVRKATGTQF